MPRVPPTDPTEKVRRTMQALPADHAVAPSSAVCSLAVGGELRQTRAERSAVNALVYCAATSADVTTAHLPLTGQGSLTR